MSRIAPVLFLAVASSGAAQDVPTFTAQVESVYVDVWVGEGETPVAGLQASDFEVRDDGVLQEVELIATSRPLHAVLVLDTSASVAGAPLDALKRAVAAFLGGLAPEDRATLVTFSHARRVQGPLAGDPAAVAATLPGISASGTTALHDAVFAGLRLATPGRGRPALIVFSDGKDRVSWLGADSVEAAARECEAVVYVVDSSGRTDTLRMSAATEAGTPDPGAAGLSSDYFVAPRGTGVADRRSRYRTGVLKAHETSVFLRRLSDQSGGRVWTAGGSDRLGESFLAALTHLKSRYLLRYEPAGVAPEGWHALDVRLRGKKGAVRARRGYLAAAPPK